jgi:hypothetical protein
MTAAEMVIHARIGQVWGALGGGEIKRKRSQAFWRNGDGWSVTLNDDKNCWFDHRDGVGGGVLDLIQRVRGGSPAEALRWLSEFYALPLDGASPEQRRRYAKARRRAPRLALAAEIWHIERHAELDELKLDAAERDDILALEAAAREDDLLRNHLNATGIVRAYLDAKEKSPEHTAALVARGKKWRRATETALAMVIAQWAQDAHGLDRWEDDGGDQRFRNLPDGVRRGAL